MSLYEMLTGALPFDGGSDYAIQQRIVEGRYLPLRARAPHLSEHLATVVAKALEVPLAERFDRASTFAEQLRAVPELAER